MCCMVKVLRNLGYVNLLYLTVIIVEKIAAVNVNLRKISLPLFRMGLTQKLGVAESLREIDQSVFHVSTWLWSTWCSLAGVEFVKVNRMHFLACTIRCDGFLCYTAWEILGYNWASKCDGICTFLVCTTTARVWQRAYEVFNEIWVDRQTHFQ